MSISPESFDFQSRFKALTLFIHTSVFQLCRERDGTFTDSWIVDCAQNFD